MKKRSRYLCPDCPKQCFCGSTQNLEQNHFGGNHHVPALTQPFCKQDHADFHVRCQQAGVDFKPAPNRILGLIQALKAMLVGMWMVVESMEKHAKKQLEDDKNEPNT